MEKQLERQLVFVLAAVVGIFAGALNAASITVVTDDAGGPEVATVWADLDIFVAVDGETVFRGDDVQWLNVAGEPHIPWKVITVLLPPNVEPSTVWAGMKNIRYELVAGTWDVPPTAPPTTWSNGEKIVVWPEGKRIVDGYDVDIYDLDAFWPEAEARVLCTGQLRKFQLAQAAVPLVRYNPVTGQLLKLVDTGLDVGFARKPMTQAMSGAARQPDRIGRARVKKLAVNFERASRAYARTPDLDGESMEMQAMGSGQQEGADAGEPNGYVIITLADINSNSTKLDDFVTQKESMGFDVNIITESDFGGGTGDTGAENIRDWLKNNYQDDDIGYVLLIGDPNHNDSNIPMKLLCPRCGAGSDEEAPSDYYYADLTGDWDLDNDSNYGEYNGDFGTGGVDRFYEVKVGRIPYYATISDLDTILQRIIDYEDDVNAAEEWRKNILIPSDPLSAGTPGWRIGEQIKWSIAEAEGWSSHRIYDQDYDLDPAPETTPCTVANTRDVWNGTDANSDGNFGLVTWFTHGSATAAVDVMDTSNTSQLDANYPSFVYSGSCNNSYPENSGNLSYTLLKDAGICTVGATRVTWYLIANTNYNDQEIDNIGFEYAERLVRERMDCGEALHDLKQVYDPLTAEGWMNYVVYNIYGEPSLHIIRGDPDAHTDVTYYVDVTDGNDDANGLSWSTAWQDLQKGLDAAVDGDEIWVAQGTYTPDDPNGDRDETFRIPHGVSVYGGFPTGGSTFGNRDTDTYETILSGDVNDNDTGEPNDASRSENSYHVVMGDSEFTLDGFTISGGNANGSGQAHLTQGGGMVLSHSDANVQDCNFTDNYARAGAAVYSKYYSQPVFNNCEFTDNLSLNGGGAVYSHDANSTFTNCSLTSNSADDSSSVGGAIRVFIGTHTLANCTFTSNTVERWGGAIYCEYATLTMTDCTFTDNTSITGGALFLGDVTCSMTDCNVSDNNSIAGAGTYDGIAGGIYVSVSTSNLQMNNCILNANHAAKWGGGLLIETADVQMINCTVVNNVADTNRSGYGHGDGVHISGTSSSLDANNCIFYANEHDQITEHGATPDVTVRYSCVEDDYTGTGNISSDPCFADPNHDFHLKSQYGRFDPGSQTWVTDGVDSLCIDAGDPNYSVGDEPANNGGVINMGAYGGSSEASKGGISAPTVVNSDANNVTYNAARLNGEVTYTGGQDPNVIVYWGDNDGETTAGNWDHNEALGAQGGTFYTDISSLDDNTTYYFRCYASNSGGSDWADSTAQFTTDTLLLEDDFEADLSKWSTDWDLVTTQYVSYNHSVECSEEDNDLISNDINTVDYTSVVITFKYRIHGIDDNDNVQVQYYDGKKYDDIEEIGDDTEDTWLTYSDTITNSGGEAQYFITDFKLKIEGSSVDSDEYLWIDDVQISGAD